MDIEKLNALADRALEYRAAKGFVPVTWDTLPYRLCCLTSEAHEIEEALRAWRSVSGRCSREERQANARPVKDEIADFVLYAITIQRDLFGEVGMRNASCQTPSFFDEAERQTEPLRFWVQWLFRSWRVGNQPDVKTSLSFLLFSAVTLYEDALDFGDTLGEAIEAKLDVMQARPMLHGRKDNRT